MKKIYLGAVIAFLTLFTSCQFSENIYINDDGTGKVSFNMDGAELMDIMGEEMMKSNDGKRIDSIISFKDLFKDQQDSISKLSQAEQDKLKNLEAFQMHMVMDAEKKKMGMDMFANFNSVSELQDMFSAMNAAGKVDKNKNPNSQAAANPMSALGSEGVTETNYSFKGNVFKREVVVLDKAKLAAVKDSLGQAKMMFASSGYTLNYHFPKKIKSVSLEGATINEDGKSFTLEVNFLQYITNPEMLNVEVELEK
ncbi:hypothetical protein [uncultured Kordia sp.]|uniref:hypothetical protein n=1 Tax=uncultured Kordia sp. TaxID=507699 RepID=UPI002609C2C7|nr:hypothetical protein [uncultured Kordia sp.]